MTVKDLKDILENIPEHFKVGFNRVSSVYGYTPTDKYDETFFTDIGDNINMDFNHNRISLGNIHC